MAGKAVRKVSEYARTGGDVAGQRMGSQPKPSDEELRDFVAFVRQLMIWLMTLIVVYTGARPQQAKNALNVAVFGAATSEEHATRGGFHGGLFFGDLLGDSLGMLLRWREVVEKLRAKDSAAKSGSQWDPLGMMGSTAHSATKNNRDAGGTHGQKAQAITHVKAVVSEDWGMFAAIGNVTLLLQQLVMTWNAARFQDKKPFTPGMHRSAPAWLQTARMYACLPEVPMHAHVHAG